MALAMLDPRHSHTGEAHTCFQDPWHILLVELVRKEEAGEGDTAEPGLPKHQGLSQRQHGT